MRRRRIWHGIIRVLLTAVALTLLLGAVLRFAGRDEYRATALLFYPLSWPVQAAGWAALGGVMAAARQRWFCVGCAVLAVAAWAGWQWQTRGFRRDLPAAHGREVSLLFWNLDRPKSFPEAAGDLLRRLDPDIAAFAEAGDLTTSALAEMAAAFPDRRIRRLSGDLLVLAKGAIRHDLSRHLPNRTHFHRLEVTAAAGGEWTLGLADFGSLPPFPRTARLNAIRRLCQDRPLTLIAGDFNTPLESAGFDAWREKFHHGLADCASFAGGVETWPFGLPLLAIDHVWLSRDLVPVAAEKGYVAGRDHAWLFVRAAARE